MCYEWKYVINNNMSCLHGMGIEYCIEHIIICFIRGGMLFSYVWYVREFDTIEI